MPDPILARFVAAVPLAVGGVLILFNPFYDRIIEYGAEREFKDNNYLGEGESHTPVSLITRYTSWALDVTQAGPLVFIPLVGLVAALNGETKGIIGIIDFIFVFVGFAVFVFTVATKQPVMYGAKKYGFKRGDKLWPAWTKVSIVSMILYIGAAIAAFILA